mgnify:CR=1 FL=1
MEPTETSVLGAALEVLSEDQSVFLDFMERGLSPVGNSLQPVAMEPDARTYMRLLPAEPFGPPEVCYPHKAPSEQFGVSVYPFEAGKGVFIPWNPAACYYTDGYDVWALFMKDVLTIICGAVCLSENLTPMVEVTHGRKEDVDLIHFVNVSGHYGTSFFDPVVLHDITVEVPWFDKDLEWETLYTPDNAVIQEVNGKLYATVKALGFYECIVIRKK